MNIPLNQIVGKNIKSLRTYANITQSKLADLLNVSTATISLFEKGERSVSLEHLLTISRVFNVKIDELCTVSTYEMHQESEVYFEHFKIGSSTIYTYGETRISNPHSMYFTLEDSNGDTLIFLRSTEVTEGVMLVSESQILSRLEKIDIDDLKNKRLFLTTISTFDRQDGKEPIYTFTDHSGKNMIMKNKAMFIYYGYLIARINHLAKTEEFFFEIKS